MNIDYHKYRLTYEGGKDFVNTYLKPYSTRESAEDFAKRKDISYCPAFAKAIINEIKNSIFERLGEVSRTNIDKRYSELVNGKNGGIDGKGSSLNYFIGQELLPELLTLGKVGIFIDRDKLDNPTLSGVDGNPPYASIYTAENIREYQVDRRGNITYIKLDSVHYDYNEFGLIDFGSKQNCIKTLTLQPNGVRYVRENLDGEKEDILLNVKRIPFIIVELSDSLLRDVADYQIALLNIASSDIAWCMLSNFPFYVEQVDPRISSEYLKGESDNTTTNRKERELGTQHGRTYGKDLTAPGFIHPSSEPLKASMEKQEVLKAEMRLLVNLALSNLKPQHASAESKREDMTDLEAGLSYIGLALQHAEQKLVEIFNLYWNTNNDTVEIKYPKRYSLKTEKERIDEAKALSEMSDKVNSLTFKKEIFKLISKRMLGDTVNEEKLNEINQQIDELPVIISHENIQRDIELGFCSKKFGGKLVGYPEDVVEEADKEYAERLALMQAAQESDKPKDVSSGADNKSASQSNDLGGSGGRGEGK